MTNESFRATSQKIEVEIQKAIGLGWCLRRTTTTGLSGFSGRADEDGTCCVRGALAVAGAGLAADDDLSSFTKSVPTLNNNHTAAEQALALAHGEMLALEAGFEGWNDLDNEFRPFFRLGVELRERYVG